jgi:hypothetical protein
MSEDEDEIMAEVKADMVREALFERIVDLRDRGVSYRGIANQTGLRVRQIWDMLHVVDGDK